MKKPKVLLTRALPQPGMDTLAGQIDLEVYEKNEAMPRAVLIERLQDKDGLICLLSDRIDREVIDAGRALKIIANYAVGYNNIDVAAAAQKNIYVTNTPGVLTDTTADCAFALLMSVARRIPEADTYVRKGRFVGWKPMLLLGTDVHGKTLGIIGFGRIGRALAHRAHDGFHMRVLYHEPERLSIDVEKQYGAEYRSLDDLLRESDYVSVHVPLTGATHHLIAEHQFSCMKRSAFLINTSRGPVIDEQALVAALKDKRIAGCALDVFEREPAVAHELTTMSNVVLTPHIGSASTETREQMACMVAGDVIAVLVHGQKPAHPVPASSIDDRADEDR